MNVFIKATHTAYLEAISWMLHTLPLQCWPQYIVQTLRFLTCWQPRDTIQVWKHLTVLQI